MTGGSVNTPSLSQWQQLRAERDDLPLDHVTLSESPELVMTTTVNGMTLVWSGEMDARGVCPSLSSLPDRAEDQRTYKRFARHCRDAGRSVNRR
jgi:hypothetical protein